MAEYIDKEAALSLVQPDAPEDEKAAITIATAKKLIRNILHRTPSADVAPVLHGRWIGGDYDKCSVCGGLELGRTNYCPHCGAKMDEVSE